MLIVVVCSASETETYLADRWRVLIVHIKERYWSLQVVYRTRANKSGSNSYPFDGTRSDKQPLVRLVILAIPCCRVRSLPKLCLMNAE